MAGSEKREDILVSICFNDIPPTSASIARLCTIIDRIESRFLYWEVLIAVDSAFADAPAYQDLLSAKRNVRLLFVRGVTGYYRRRALAAAEAIGDAVVITTLEEAETLDLCDLLEKAHGSETVIAVKSGAGKAILGSPLVWLGKAAGFHVSSAIMQSVALPRVWLNRVLSHPDYELALRFPPRSEGMPIRYETVDQPVKRDAGEHRRRLALAQSLLVCATPSILPLVGVISAVAVVAGIVYALYAVMIWLFLEDVQKGWFTTSIFLSGSVIFLGAAIGGVSMGMLKILQRLEADPGATILDEKSEVDLFRDSAELNVDQTAQPGA